LRRPVFLLTPILLTVISLCAAAEVPDFWSSYMSWNGSEYRIPEDEEMGLLADLRYPDPAWKGILPVCDAAFASLGEGAFPEEQIYPPVRPLLRLEMERILEDIPRRFSARYGRPKRKGGRVDLPVRLQYGQEIRYGVIYFIRSEGNWYIDQWNLDLSSGG